MDRPPDHPAETLRKIEAHLAGIYRILETKVEETSSRPKISSVEFYEKLWDFGFRLWLIVVLLGLILWRVW